MRHLVLCCALFILCGVAYATVELEEGVNQLQNWSFEKGVIGLCAEQIDGNDPVLRRCMVPPGMWEIEDDASGATGRIELDDREVYSGSFSMKMTPVTIDGTGWHLKVKQDNLSFEGGKKHTIKFWAKAETPRVVQLCLQMNHEPWDGWLWEDVNLTEDWQEFVIEVIPPVDNDQEHWLAFHYGQSLTTWWLDNVRYYRGAPDDEIKTETDINGERIDICSSYGPMPIELHVEGSRLKNANGEAVRLQGVNVASLEWNNTGDFQMLESLRVSIHNWNANAIRLPLSQDRWFGKAEGQNDDGRLYQMIVDEFVRYISGNGAYAILDLHWSNAGVWGEYIGQHYMPDMNSLEFWKSVCAIYANNPAVLFDLYNEPHDVSWDIWKFGGSVTEPQGLSYESPGMQGLLDVVRSAGAENIVIIGGLDWGYNLRGIPEYKLDDPHGNVMYSTHIYPWKGHEEDWDECIGHVLGEYPILVGEVGSEPGAWSPYPDYDPYTWSDEVLSYIQRHELNWTAWDFHPYAGPSLIEDWKYNPTSYWGDFVKRALESAPRINHTSGSWDINRDGKIDIYDLILVAQYFGEDIAIPLYPNADVNCDGTVDLLDIILVAQHFGEVYSSTAPSKAMCPVSSMNWQR
jgi:hypothetical protein